MKVLIFSCSFVVSIKREEEGREGRGRKRKEEENNTRLEGKNKLL